APHRVFTCIFAFADQPGYDEYGTQFVRPRDPRARCWGDLHHDEANFEVATVAKYVPNSFVVFFKTRQSFHSVKELHQELPNQRYGMQLGYYEPHGGLFRDLSRPDLMEDRTTKPIVKFTAFGRTLQINRS
ncbi:MAG: methyltransferase FkbM family, partial [Myxococcales bacterium]|nr:methyltransferase FkbM family [Myxococcales bacterium]